MPELPDVEVYKRRLARGALGKTITRVAVGDARILGKLSPRNFRGHLVGRKLLSTRRHGKHLLARIEGNGWLTLHFGMTGDLRVFNESEPRPRFTRVCLDLAGHGHLAYINKRMIGRVGLAPNADAFIAAEKLGPDALDRGFTLAAFKKAIAGARRDVKSVLMDQQIVAGIGNIYADEILFQARIDPRAGIAKLDAARLARLYRAIGTALRMAIAHGAGSEELAERMPKSALLPHRHKGGHCPRCGGPLKTTRIGGRMTYFCAHCQRR
ncbi:MAG TPA: DNA-formamidopyrimidine glycosylase family protein [Stellaceae bacterium]|nr:DNA-formamidopyrimidine glycosylase family protein [Stellaceae bacterium]